MTPEGPQGLAPPVEHFHVPHGRIHELLSWPFNFEDGSKRFELRRDRGFQIGDVLLLREWDPEKHKYTGRGTRVRVASIMHGAGMAWFEENRTPNMEGFVVLSLEPVYSAPMHCPCCGSEWQCPKCPIPEQLSIFPGEEELRTLSEPIFSSGVPGG